MTKLQHLFILGVLILFSVPWPYIFETRQKKENDIHVLKNVKNVSWLKLLRVF